MDACTLAALRPRFGQLAETIAGVTPKQLGECLEEQQRAGGRLGEILLARGHINLEQLARILQHQAHWTAEAVEAHTGAPLPGGIFLSLCFPAFNEATNIEDTLTAACAILPEFVDQFEVVVVDDGSSDATAEIVERFSRAEPRVRLVQHEHNLGYGGAVTSGLRAGCGNLLAFMDSDGQFSLLDLPQLLIRLSGHDAVIGYRYRRADSSRRLLMAWSWNRLLRASFGVRVRDMDCAFKLFRREVIDQSHLTLTSPGINAQILIQCMLRGWQLCETPVMHYPRYHGVAAGCGWRMIARAFRELPQLWKCRFRPQPEIAQPAEAMVGVGSGKAAPATGLPTEGMPVVGLPAVSVSSDSRPMASAFD